MNGPRLVCISDTHGRHDAIDVPAGDVLVHAGDFTMRGDDSEVRAFADWFLALPHEHKVLVAGNHDHLFERAPDAARALVSSATYLEDAGADVAGLSFWGSPWQPEFGGWAFNLKPGEPLAAKWRLVPSDVDVLVTHVPPFGRMDRIHSGENIGCPELTRELERIAPSLHVFGHVHECRGASGADPNRVSVNAAICDERYHAVHAPIVVERAANGWRFVDAEASD